MAVKKSEFTKGFKAGQRKVAKGLKPKLKAKPGPVPKKQPTSFVPKDIMDGGSVRMADVIMNATAVLPKGPLSTGMQALLDYGKELLIVRTPWNSIKNQDEFTQQMSALGFKVIYLEYNPTFGSAPLIERYPRP